MWHYMIWREESMRDKEIIAKILELSKESDSWNLRKYLKSLNEADLNRLKDKCLRLGLCKAKDTDAFIKEICGHMTTSATSLRHHRDNIILCKNVALYLGEVQRLYKHKRLTPYAVDERNLDFTHAGNIANVDKLAVKGHTVIVRDEKRTTKDVNNIVLLKHSGVCAVCYNGVTYYKSQGQLQSGSGVVYANDFFTTRELYFCLIKLLYKSFSTREKTAFIHGIKNDANLVINNQSLDDFEDVFVDGKNTISANMSGLHNDFSYTDFLKVKERIQSMALHLKEVPAEVEWMKLVIMPLENLEPECPEDFQYYYEEK